jgi:hypothetical protein
VNTIKVLALSALLLGATAAAAADIYVIAHPGLKLSPDEAREAFLGEKQFAGPQRIVAFDNAAAQADFLRKVYDMDVNKYNTIWAKKGFRDGLNPPAVKGSDVEVLSAVRATPGAIGYVSTPPAGVTVIRRY